MDPLVNPEYVVDFPVFVTFLKFLLLLFSNFKPFVIGKDTGQAVWHGPQTGLLLEFSGSWPSA